MSKVSSDASGGLLIESAPNAPPGIFSVLFSAMPGRLPCGMPAMPHMPCGALFSLLVRDKDRDTAPFPGYKIGNTSAWGI